MLPDLRSLADPDLVEQVKELVATDRQITADLLVHLAEVEERRLFVEAACSSLFTWCIEVLHLSEDVANKRIRAARLVKRFPALYPALADGRLHLSGILLLGSQLDEDNQDELIAEASGKSKRQIEQLLADRKPKPDVSARARRVRRRPVASRRPAHAQAGGDDQGGLFDGRRNDAAEPEVTRGGADAPAAPSRQPQPEPPAPRERRERGRIDPLGEERYKVQFMASAELVADLKLAADLLSHRMPVDDLAAVVEEAVTQLCERLMKERFGTSRKGKKAKKPPAPRRASGETATGPGAGCPTSPKRPPSRHVPMDVRREVFERDGHRCTYVDPATGRRCGETRYLELHHEREWARYHSHDPDHITLRCRVHNDFAARRDYGEEHMRRCKSRGHPPS